ncbi:MAG TPA: hypothetical protein VJ418_23920 [Streptosporangiaceae bacterium]|nr:hypothetical protein [Streptosporangiaceae bacterium]
MRGVPLTRWYHWAVIEAADPAVTEGGGRRWPQQQLPAPPNYRHRYYRAAQVL